MRILLTHAGIPIYVLYIGLVVISLLIGLALLGSPLSFFAVLALSFLAVSLISPYTSLLLVIFSAIVQPGVLFPEYAEYRPFLFIAAFTALGWLGTVFVKQDFKFMPSIQNKILIAFVLIAILSVSQYFWTGEILKSCLGWSKNLIIYFMILYLVNSIPKLKGALWTVIIAIAIVVIKAQYDHHYFSGAALALRLSAYGMYGNANDLALALVLAWPITYKLWELENTGLKKVFLFGLLSLFALSLLFTASRGGILGFSIVSLLTVLSSRSTPGIHKSILIILIIIGVAIIGYPRVLSRPDVETFVGGDVSAEKRLDAWMAGIYIFLSHPVLGVGYGHYMEYAPYYGATKGMAAHNTVIKVAAETGVFGLLAFIGMLWVAFKRNWTLIKTIPSQAPIFSLAQAFFISLIGFVVNTTFSTKDGDWLLYVILAGSAVVWYLCNSGQMKSEIVKVS